MELSQGTDHHQTSFRTSAVHLETPNAMTHQYFASLTLGTPTVSIGKTPSAVLTHSMVRRAKDAAAFVDETPNLRN